MHAPRTTREQSPSLATAAASHRLLSQVVDILVEYVKMDRHGAFWLLGPEHRNSDNRWLEHSLGYGSAGSLWVLLQYYRLSGDREIRDLIAKGVGRLFEKTKGLPIQHGLYGGSAGLWFLFSEIAELLPFEAEVWKAHATLLVEGVRPADTVSNITGGVAGTIIGYLCAVGHPVATKPLRLVDHVAAAAKLHPAGVFWDFNHTSIRSPAGFARGNAGIEYMLGFLRRAQGCDYSSLLRGAIGYSTTLYDATSCDWGEGDIMVDGAVLSRKVTNFSEERLLRQIAETKLVRTLGWGGGTAGILLSRAFCASSYPENSEVHELCLRDTRYAVERICTAPESEIAALDSTILSGLPGLTLALGSVIPMLPTHTTPLKKVLESARERLVQRTVTPEGEDFSLLRGIAGIGYTAAALAHGLSDTALVHPAQRYRPSSSVSLSTTPGDLVPFFTRRCRGPATIPTVRQELSAGTVSLATVERVLRDLPAETVPPEILRTAAYEVSLHVANSRVCYQREFLREQMCKSRFQFSYQNAPDQVLLMQRFKISSSAALVSLDFEPTSGALHRHDNYLAVRLQTSAGVVETRLSDFQFAVLHEFRTQTVAIKAVATTVGKVRVQEGSIQRVAALGLIAIRRFLEHGILIPAEMGWLRRKWERRLNRPAFAALFGADGVSS